jgi:cellulose synthase/poly-beta-1,6-N-acetylglucosamine synthase-like glycosyltransferase
MNIDLYFIIFLLFLLSQILYSFGNISLLYILFSGKDSNLEFKKATNYKDLSVYIPLYKEREEIIMQTLERIENSTYPLENITVYIVYEESDDIVTEYITRLYKKEYIKPISIWNDDPFWDFIKDKRHKSLISNQEFPQNKARCLTYALYVTKPEGIITVLDSDTGFEPTLFEHGVSALEKDVTIVQAKQTVRNYNDGIIPYLESAGISAWSSIIYANTTRMPFQLLGKGYFLESETLFDTFGWNPYSNTEDMTLGLDLYNNNEKLLVLNTYITDLCPNKYSIWVKQKRRWVKGPYEHFKLSKWKSIKELFQFCTYTLTPQLVTLTNIIGIPVGIAMGFLVLNSLMSLPTYVVILTIFNALCWIGYGIRTYQVSIPANKITSKKERIKYILLNNPVFQTFYATLWAYPIILAIIDTISGKQRDFGVTEK